MTIKFTREQVQNLLFELITAKATEQQRLESAFALEFKKETIEYQIKCVERTDELITIVDKALKAPFD